MRSLRAAATAAALFVSVGAGAPTPAAALELRFPLSCALGVDCWVQQGVDRDPGAGASDHACGPHSYDGHRGVDIRLADDAAITADVAVLAPASGRVTAARDGVADGELPEGQDCGNGLVLDHGGGWETQMCHLRQGSLVVSVGDRVQSGDVLGAVGLSGRTQFPHLHIAVRRDGAFVDPADGRAVSAPCGQGGASLWSPASGMDAPPGGVHASGLRMAPPDYEDARAGLAQARTLPARGPSLTLWALFHALAPGDRLKMRVVGPQGEVVAREVVADRAQAERFLFAGRRTPATGWPPGRYEAVVRLVRDGAQLSERRASVEVR